MQEVPQSALVFRFGIFEADAASGELRKQGSRLKLQEQPFRILITLLDHAGEVVSREEICRTLWGPETFVDYEQGLGTAIKKLRQALGDDAETPRYIETLPKRGYRFIAAVEKPAGRETFLIPDTSAPAPSAVHAPRTWKWLWVALGAAAFVALLSFGVFRFRTAPIEPITSIAVLPFVNATHDASAEYLSDGISEEIVNSLSTAPNLKVIARTTAFHFKNQEVNAKKVGQELGVGALLMGTLTRSGNTVTVQTDLVNVADGTELWGERYRRDITNFQGLEADIAREIVDALRLRLVGDEQKRLTKRYTENSEAYQLYLKGIYEFRGCCYLGSLESAQQSEGLQRSISYLRQAIAKDPKFALAHLQLAYIYDSLGGWRRLPVREAFTKGKDEVEKALRIDDGLGEAHAELAFALMRLDWDWPGADREFKLAMELKPNGTYETYSDYLLQVGRRQEGLAEAQRAVEIDPLSSSTLLDASFVHYMARDYDEALKEARRGAAGKPSFWLALALEQKGMYAEAIANLEQLGDSAAVRGHLGHVYAMAGKIAEAQGILRELQARAGKQQVGAYEIAFIYAALGQKDLAFQWLEKAYEQHDTGMTYLKTDPCLDPLRQDPRFEQMERRVGLPS